MNTRNTQKLLLAISILGVSSLPAQTLWNVSTGGNWDTAGNWNPATVPNAIDADARITNINTAGAHTIDASSAQTFTVGRLDLSTNSGATTNDIDLSVGSNVGLVFDVSSGAAQLNFVTNNNAGSTILVNSAIQLNDNLTSTVTRTNAFSTVSPTLAGSVNLQGNTWNVGTMTQGIRFTGLISGTGSINAGFADHGSIRDVTFTNTANTYSGGTTVGRNNRLVLGTTGTSFTGTSGGGILGTGTITVNGTTNDGSAATIQSNGNFVSNDFTDTTTNVLTNTISLGAGTVLRVDTSRPLNFSGSLVGSGRIVKVTGSAGGIRQLALNTANAGFTGTIEIQDGQLQTRVTNALGTGSTIQFNAQNNTNGVGLQGSMASGTDVSIGSTLDFVKNGNSHFIGTSGGSTFTITGNFSNSGAGAAGYIGFGRGNQNNAVGNGGFATGTNTGTATIRLTGTGTLENAIGIVDGSSTQSVLSLGNTSGTQTFSGVISGNGDLVRNGAGGTTILSGATNAYSGTTTVTAGTLLVNGAHTGGAAYTVNGGNLGGIGSIGSATSMSSGSLVAGGIGATGNLTFTNGLALTGGTVAWEINANSAATGFDSITISGGALSIGANVATFEINALGGVDFSNGFWATDQSWTVLNNTGAGTITGTFLLGGTTSNAFGSFNLAYGSGAGGDVTLNWTATVIPEPSSFAALAGLGVLGLAASRRRRSA